MCGKRFCCLADVHDEDKAVAADLVYAMERDELARLVIAETERGTAHSVAGSDRYDWSYYGGPAGHRAMRQESARTFAADVAAHPARYVAAALPALPFADGQFDLVLSSHLLFTYADRLDLEFHRSALMELVRVAAGEARVFPLVAQGGQALNTLIGALVTGLPAVGIDVELRRVPYEFQRGGHTMMVLRA